MFSILLYFLASDVLLTVAYDQTVKVWNLEDTSAPQFELEVSDVIF